MAVDSEKFKELYLFQKSQFEDEINRFNRLEDKAVRYLGSLTIAVSAFVIIVRWGAEKFIPPTNILEWVTVILISITLVAVVSAWSCVFCALQLQTLIKLNSDESMINYFKENKKETVYLGLAQRYSESCLKVAAEYEKKLKHVRKGYKEIIFAGWCFIISLVLIFSNIWNA